MVVVNYDYKENSIVLNAKADPTSPEGRGAVFHQEFLEKTLFSKEEIASQCLKIVITEDRDTFVAELAIKAHVEADVLRALQDNKDIITYLDNVRTVCMDYYQERQREENGGPDPFTYARFAVEMTALRGNLTATLESRTTGRKEARG